MTIMSYYYSIFFLLKDPAISSRLCPLTNCREESGADEAHCCINSVLGMPCA